MKSCYICNKGCIARLLDSQRVSYYLQKNNYRITGDPKKADYIIIFTCGVTNEIAKICFDLIEEFQKYNAELIIAGCIPAIQKKQLEDIFKGKVIFTEDLNKNPGKIDHLFPDNKIKFRETGDIDIKFDNKDEETPLEKIKKTILSSKMRRYLILHNLLYIDLIGDFGIKFKLKFLKKLFGEKSSIIHYYKSLSNYPLYPLRISWGCTGKCTYCGIKNAVGPHVSKPFEVCIDEFKKGLKMGYKDFIIFSEDTGAYGTDIGSNLPELLEKITSIDGEYKIFLEDLNPVWVVKYIDRLEKIFKNGKIVGLLCPIQSGSSRILKLMKRYSNIETIKNSYARLKKSNPSLIILIHIMIGFPTETMEDVKETISFVTDDIFDSGQFFRFSCVPNSQAEKIEPKILKNILDQRVKNVKKFLKKQGYNTISIGDGMFFYKK